MSISTTVFAPTVRTVQPAFIYSTGEAKFYFSLSSYNTKADIQALRYTLIDPNKKSAYGNNSMINTEDKYITISDIDSIALDQKTGEYYFTICFGDDFKVLNVNQYYQIQIELQDKNEFWSAPSQASLIRPIPAGTFYFDLADNAYATDLKEISGHYEYVDNSTKEYLSTYRLTILQRVGVVHQTGWLTNVNGLSLNCKVSYTFQEGQNYQLKIEGVTVNGYCFTAQKEITVNSYAVIPAWEAESAESGFVMKKDEITNLNKIKSNVDRGAVSMEIAFPAFDGYLLIQRTDEDSNFNLWQDIFKLELDGTDAQNTLTTKGITIYDYFVDGCHRIYKYRFAKVEAGVVTAITKGNYEIECIYEDIFLADTKKQLGIKYNPVISNVKWVVQESVTNTLGGKYPLIKRNGDTYYKQFTLNGTLYFDPLALSPSSRDSQSRAMDTFIPSNINSLFINVNEALGNAWNNSIWNSRPYKNRVAVYEQRFKDAAMSFLTDGKPKLFRSPTEGLMIVALTGVSFSPNKQLDHRVVDFSATVTEFAELTTENLIRYGLAPDIETVCYILEAETSALDNQTLILTPYITEDKIINNNDNEYYLKVVEKAVRI